MWWVVDTSSFVLHIGYHIRLSQPPPTTWGPVFLPGITCPATTRTQLWEDAVLPLHELNHWEDSRHEHLSYHHKHSNMGRTLDLPSHELNDIQIQIFYWLTKRDRLYQQYKQKIKTHTCTKYNTMIQKWKTWRDEEILVPVRGRCSDIVYTKTSYDSYIIGTLLNETHRSYIHAPLSRKV